jgi:hypothetical protein
MQYTQQTGEQKFYSVVITNVGVLFGSLPPSRTPVCLQERAALISSEAVGPKRLE